MTAALTIAVILLAACAMYLRLRVRGQRDSISWMIVDHDTEKTMLADEVFRLDAELCTARWEIDRLTDERRRRAS